MSPKANRRGDWSAALAIASAYVTWGVGKLLSTNAKLEKIPRSSQRYLVRGMSLAPHMQSGRNVCPWAGACVAACVLWFAGRTVMANVRDAMIARTKWYHGDRATFLAALYRELAALVRAAEKADAIPVCRLNVASDIVWERVAPEVFARFPTVQFFDYTKARFDQRDTLPANYVLSHSFHERTTLADVAGALAAGRNVVVVFDTDYNPRHRRGRKFGALPARVTFTDSTGATIDCETVDGDIHDVRIPALDGRGVVVALRGKGGRVRVEEAAAAGFVQRYPGLGRADSRPDYWSCGATTVVCCG